MIKDKKVLAIIPARAGSKGVEGKNYQPINGQPLVEWSIQAALKSEYIDMVIVTSNCSTVRQVCEAYTKQFGSKIGYLHRPHNLCEDDSSTEDAISHALVKLAKKDLIMDYIVLLQPTSPIRTNRLIDNCLEQIYSRQKDTLVTVDKHTPFFWNYTEEESTPTYEPEQRPMRQDLNSSDFFWHENGNVYITETKSFVENKCRIGNNVTLYETDRLQSMQIDTPWDFKFMQACLDVSGTKDLTGEYE